MSTTIASSLLGIADDAPKAPPPGRPGDELLPLSVRYRLLVWTPVVIALVIGAAMWPFISHALLSNVWLNGKIMLVMMWGVWTMAGHVQRVYHEDAVFRNGMAWLRGGALSGQPNPKFGQPAYVTGMLERLSKLGLGHQVYVHSAAAEPEIDALGHYLEQKQDLSQFLVGLMVGLGLLGTFVGLLQTLVQTSELIGTIANSAGGGGKMEEEFAKIVGGLQGPLAGMGTAFSASMFGLVGSILLGFQLVVVRKTAADFVERARHEVLSLAEASKVNEKVEITERFLATLMADMVEQQRTAVAGFADVTRKLDALVPRIEAAATATVELGMQIRQQEQVLERTVATVGAVGQVVPLLGEVALASRGILGESKDMHEQVRRMLAHLPEQTSLLHQVSGTLGEVKKLGGEVGALRGQTVKLQEELSGNTAVVKRMDSTLWNVEKDSLRHALAEPPTKGGPTTDRRR